MIPDSINAQDSTRVFYDKPTENQSRRSNVCDQLKQELRESRIQIIEIESELSSRYQATLKDLDPEEREDIQDFKEKITPLKARARDLFAQIGIDHKFFREQRVEYLLDNIKLRLNLSSEGGDFTSRIEDYLNDQLYRDPEPSTWALIREDGTEEVFRFGRSGRQWNFTVPTDSNGKKLLPVSFEFFSLELIHGELVMTFQFDDETRLPMKPTFARVVKEEEFVQFITAFHAGPHGQFLKTLYSSKSLGNLLALREINVELLRRIDKTSGKTHIEEGLNSLGKKYEAYLNLILKAESLDSCNDEIVRREIVQFETRERSPISKTEDESLGGERKSLNT
jgi:hypothetical protein